MDKRHCKGLNFSCDEKYTLKHKYAAKSFLIIEGDFYNMFDLELASTKDSQTENINHDAHDPEISLHAMQGFDLSTTLRLLGTINSVRLMF